MKRLFDLHAFKQAIMRKGDPNGSVIPILDRFEEIPTDALRSIIHLLKNHQRPKHALEVSEWLIQRSRFKIEEDAPIHLALIAKVHGLQAAERYFQSIPDSLNSLKINGSLLSCYALSKKVEKAEIMKMQMEWDNFIKGDFVYSEMLSMYAQLGDYESFQGVLKEMVEKKIKFSGMSYSILLNGYIGFYKFKEMEKVVAKMVIDPDVTLDFFAYSILGKGYTIAGKREKALYMLKKAEELICESSNSKRHNHYEQLIAQHSFLGNKEEVYRLWELYKCIGLQLNKGYLAMVSSCVRLEDFDAAESIYKEWEACSTTVFDARIPAELMKGFSLKVCPEKVEKYLESIVRRGKPAAIHYNFLAGAYVRSGDMGRAVEALKKSIMLSDSDFVPSIKNLKISVEFLRNSGDESAVCELIKMLNDKASNLHLAARCLLEGKIHDARDFLKMSILDCKPEKQFDIDIMVEFLEQLNMEGEVKVTAELLKMIKEHCYFSRTSYNRLLSGLGVMEGSPGKDPGTSSLLTR